MALGSQLGSGAGADVLISARRVGSTGKAIGLDMTDEMLELARTNARDAGAENVEFLKHSREEQYSYVLEGRMGALLGDDVVHADTGDLVFKPRDQWHTFRNTGNRPCRILEIISPGGFEHCFDEMALALASPNFAPEQMAELPAATGSSSSWTASRCSAPSTGSHTQCWPQAPSSRRDPPAPHDYRADNGAGVSRRERPHLLVANRRTRRLFSLRER